MEIYPRITVKPGRCGGKPCIRGYNLSVETILELLTQGATRADLFRDWGFLEDEDIDAALAFGSQQDGEHLPPTYGGSDIVH